MPGIWKSLMATFRHNRALGFGLILFIILITVSLGGRLFLPAVEVSKTDYGRALLAPSLVNFLGTDELGRDLLTLIIYGLGMDLIAVTTVLFFSLLIGTIIGGIAGFTGGVGDEILMRFTDIFFALPPFVLAMAIAAALGKGIVFTMMSLTIATWPSFARLVRGQILKEKEKNYVEALRALCIPRWRIFVHHMLPNIIYPVLIYAITIAGVTVLYLAGLSYIGFGPGPFTPELGQMISRGYQHTFTHPHQVMLPGLILVFLVLAFNFLGEGLKGSSTKETNA
jgi:peptide/nickel transport system permease protein